MSTLFIDYFGAPDNKYTREASMLFVLGAVARIYEPGHKFDFVPIFEGLQGKRKSTFIETLAVDPDWSGALNANLKDEKEGRGVHGWQVDSRNPRTLRFQTR